MLFSVGYVILYTDNESKTEADWSAEAINGDKHSCVLTNLRPSTIYYFKIQARNSRGYGPFSKVISYRTGQSKENIFFVHLALLSFYFCYFFYCCVLCLFLSIIFCW